MITWDKLAFVRGSYQYVLISGTMNGKTMNGKQVLAFLIGSVRLVWVKGISHLGNSLTR